MYPRTHPPQDDFECLIQLSVPIARIKAHAILLAEHEPVLRVCLSYRRHPGSIIGHERVRKPVYHRLDLPSVPAIHRRLAMLACDRDRKFADGGTRKVSSRRRKSDRSLPGVWRPSHAITRWL
jgi:hypothetical protein